MATRNAIFDFDKKTGKRRTDVIYNHEGLPICTHQHFGYDPSEELMKCIDCEMAFLFQTEKEFDAMVHRYVPNWNFKTHKQMLNR